MRGVVDNSRARAVDWQPRAGLFFSSDFRFARYRFPRFDATRRSLLAPSSPRGRSETLRQVRAVKARQRERTPPSAREEESFRIFLSGSFVERARSNGILETLFPLVSEEENEHDEHRDARRTAAVVKHASPSPRSIRGCCNDLSEAGRPKKVQ